VINCFDFCLFALAVMKLSASDVTSGSVLGDRFCVSRKGGTGGGGWVHTKGANTMSLAMEGPEEVRHGHVTCTCRHFSMEVSVLRCAQRFLCGFYKYLKENGHPSKALVE